jgi:large subunit ribosomal protein L25
VSEVRLAVEPRTEFGKGAARRTRRAGKIPAVLYGHGGAPRHLSLPAVDFARVVRDNGTNAILSLEVSGERELALTKTITTHPLKNYIEHVDLLLVRRGEKVAVDIPVVVHGEAANGTLVYQELNTISVEADALNIPNEFEVSVEEAEIGTQITAGDVKIPADATLLTDPEYLVVNVVAAPTEEDMESDIDAEGAGVVEDESETDAADAAPGDELSSAKGEEGGEDESSSSDES